MTVHSGSRVHPLRCDCSICRPSWSLSITSILYAPSVDCATVSKRWGPVRHDWHQYGEVHLKLLPFVFAVLPPHHRFSNMSALFKLSTEILIQVSASSDTIPDALRLSATNSHLQNIWSAHATQIAETILRTSIPTYEKALDLAITETKLQSSVDGKPSLREYLPTLLRNADLCASACLAYSTSRKDAPSPPTSYYFLRRVGLGYEYHQIRDTLYAELKATSREVLMNHAGMGRFLLLNAGLTEQIRQGVEPEDYDEIRDLYRETESKWDYAQYCISNGAICDIDRGTNNLPTTIQGYDI